jgi:hypothetical protein
MSRLSGSRETVVCRDAVEGSASIVARRADLVITFRSTALQAAFALTGVDIRGTDLNCDGQMPQASTRSREIVLHCVGVRWTGGGAQMLPLVFDLVCLGDSRHDGVNDI